MFLSSPACYDLHLHTCWSYDASASVRPYFERARVNAVQGTARVPTGKLSAIWRERGFATTDQELLELRQQFLKVEKKMPYPAVDNVVSAVHAAGGLVVLAHPTLYVKGRDHQRLDALRAECALDGIECAHRKVAPELTDFYRDYCIEHGMVSTAGSDCHMPDDSAPHAGPWGYTQQRRFASHVGQPQWLDEFLERID